MAEDRFNREVNIREPVIKRTPQAFATVSGLWAIRDKRKNEVTGYCLSEIHANTIAAHTRHFIVEFVQGPFELSGSPRLNDVFPEGRFRRIVEEEE